MKVTIREIKKPVSVKGKTYQHVLSEEGECAILDTRYPFPPGTTLHGEVSDDFDTIEQPDVFGPEARAAWTAYYENHIITHLIPEGLPEEEERKFRLFQSLSALTNTEEEAMYFLHTFAVAGILEERLKENPYWFYGYYHGKDWRNFRKINRATIVDTFALRLEQLKSCILYLLLQNEQKGHTWMSFPGMYRGICYVMQQDGHAEPSVNLVHAILREEERFFFDGTHVALQSAYDTEMEILQNVRLLMAVQPLFHENVVFESHLCEEQTNAVDHIINGSNLSILTGKPGTGKTTTIATILKYYMETASIALLAPTARAVQRIRESLQEEFSADEMEQMQISTIHKFLGYGLPKFMQTEVIEQASRYRVCIVDESSMVDIYLFAKLLTALNLSHCKLILVGDKNQLPSIYAGNILTDLIGIGVPTYYLEQNHRSVQSIFDNGNRILNEDTQTPFIEDEHFVFLHEDSLDDVLHLVDFSREDVVLLTPYRKAYDARGNHIKGNATEINALVHQRLFTHPGFCVRDKVMCMHNNYAEGYFNGETGYITLLGTDGICVNLGGEKVVQIADKNELDYAYASTVHKVQGCEYREVYLYLPHDIPKGLLNKELLYTAVTRAKQKVTILGSKETIYDIMHISANQRQTFLSLCVQDGEKNLLHTT